MNDYDFYLRHASVRGGAWAGFLLAWKGLGGVSGLGIRPRLRWRPWVLDPAQPNNPAAGSWGTWQWRLDVAMLDGAIGLLGTPPADARASPQMRADLLAYMNAAILELKDTDGTIYSAKMTAYNEQTVEPYGPAHPNGGWLAQVEFAQT